jgi:hypothetical protein
MRFTSTSVNCVTDCANADDHSGGSITCLLRASTELSVGPEAFHLLAFDMPRGSRLLKPRSDTVRQHMTTRMQMWTEFAFSLFVESSAETPLYINHEVTGNTATLRFIKLIQH